MIKNNRAFTMIEILMVIVLVAVMAAVGANQFLDFRAEARDSATREALAVLRTGIKNQIANANLRCGSATTIIPTLADVTANDMSTNAACTAGELNNQLTFVDGGIPANPWDTASGTPTAILACSGAGCTDRTQDCDADATWEGGWCYNANTGEIWANSNANGNSDEHTF